MTAPVQIIGSYLSPYVRKVLVVLDLKGIAVRDRSDHPVLGRRPLLAALSPLRRIPVLIDDRVTLADSSVICQYLEDRHPEPAALPARRRRSRARALARGVRRHAHGRRLHLAALQPGGDQPVRVGRADRPRRSCSRRSTDDIPHVLDYLEAQLPADGLPVRRALDRRRRDRRASSATPPSRASASTPRAGRARPAFVDRVLALPGFARLKPFEDAHDPHADREAARGARRDRRAAHRARPTAPPRRAAA